MNTKHASVLALFRLLNLPLALQPELGLTRKDVANQAALASYYNSKLNINALSLNTLKAHADKYLQGGFEALDSARLSALAIRVKIEKKSSKVPASRKPSAEKSIAALKLEVQMLNEELFIYSGVLADCMEQARYFANKTSDLTQIRLCEKQQKESLNLLKFMRSKHVS
ncbi:hypothetical protein [Pseudomonas coronafaciens]|uniref:hypothetical protein n=1 Tax=Pseudomonas coronafaciens TaxID=53409 RepID=UPI0006D63227|nr:hypothetical protein [Pseudomonas coronafaciens]